MKTKLSILMMFFVTWFITGTVLGAPAKLTIESVAVNLASETITITGVGFDTVNDTTVTLGSFGALFIQSESPTEIVALLPQNITPGSHLLSVEVTRGSSQTDEFDLTIPLLRTIVVSPVGPTATDNGDALLSVMNDVAASLPTATEPVLIQIEPGTYDVGTQAITLPSHVDIQGSGPNMTTIVGFKPDINNFSVIFMSAHTQVRDLAIEYSGVAATTHSGIAMVSPVSGTAENISIENVSITGDVDTITSGPTGIFASARTMTRLRNVSIGGSQVGIEISGNAEVRGDGLDVSGTVAALFDINSDGGQILVANSQITGGTIGTGVNCLYSFDANLQPLDASCN